MASPFSKMVTDITLDDLHELLGVPESDRLEFKRSPYGRNDEDVREMLRDMTSFANAVGGYLLLGVEQDGEDRAIAIVGIESGEDEAARMLSSCRANIEEQIIGLNFHLVPVDDDRKVLIWHIPRSTRAPHMITFRGLNQFWRRHGRQKDKMSIEEIREACLRVENLRQGIADFLRERRAAVLRAVGGNPCFVLTATPLSARDEIVDVTDDAVRDLIRKPPYHRPGGWVIGFRDVRPSLNGLAASRHLQCRVEVFRTGYLECQIAVDANFCYQTQCENEMNPFAPAEYVLSFLSMVRGLSNHSGIVDPYVIGVGLLNARGSKLSEQRPGTTGWTTRMEDEIGTWGDADHIELPLTVLTPPINAGIAAKGICDRLWNAFGFEACPVFDNAGNLLLSNP